VRVVVLRALYNVHQFPLVQERDGGNAFFGCTLRNTRSSFQLSDLQNVFSVMPMSIFFSSKL